MDNKLIKKTQAHLNSFSDKQRILEELLKQINKDFGALIEMPFKDKHLKTTEEIVQILTPVVEDLQNNSPEVLRQLMYEIDLNESELYYELQGSNNDEHALIAAWMVTERELKKVVTRIHFSDNKDAFKNL
ncbi:MAG: hypothetical protein K9H84_08050 [Bacteroidales bacterium]|nr:hypothetical protein [Bacteroidales bacterium]